MPEKYIYLLPYSIIHPATNPKGYARAVKLAKPLIVKGEMSCTGFIFRITYEGWKKTESAIVNDETTRTAYRRLRREGLTDFYARAAILSGMHHIEIGLDPDSEMTYDKLPSPNRSESSKV